VSSGRVSLVTGGSGFIGHRLAQALVERGDRVRALVRDPARAEDLRKLGVELVQGDLTDEESLRRAAAGVGHVFHAAGVVGEWLNRRQAREVNVEGTRRLLMAAAGAGAIRAVHVSSLAVLGTKDHHGTDESAPYVRGDTYTDTKIESEWVARELGAGGLIEVTVIRPGFVYGPGDRHTLGGVVDALRAGKFTFVGDGSKELNTVYVDDVANAALLADETLRAAGEVYNITDGRNTSLREFINFIADYLELPQPTKQIPPAVARAAAGVFETVARVSHSKNTPLMNKSRLRFLCFNQGYSIEKARHELGYEPRFSYREGLPPSLDALGRSARGEPLVSVASDS
jgi:nucleoside-diphosphate-sugar epimerase